MQVLGDGISFRKVATRTQLVPQMHDQSVQRRRVYVAAQILKGVYTQPHGRLFHVLDCLLGDGGRVRDVVAEEHAAQAR